MLRKEASGVHFETPLASVQVAALTIGEPDMFEMSYRSVKLYKLHNSLSAMTEFPLNDTVCSVS